MKCDICGAELSGNDKVCSICGNVIGNRPDMKTTKEKPRIERRNVYKEKEHDLTGDESVVVADHDAVESKFCTRCGRLLDNETHLCRICDVRELELMRIRKTANTDLPHLRTERAEAEKRKKQIRKNITAAVVMTLLATFVITAFVFFKLLGGGAAEEEITESTPEPTEQAEETEFPIIDDGDGEVHWRPANE
ncbi:MAG: hypothetical protein IJH94_00960 [Clostridia bacterium]|nr:hypothetical protein [Clostridia bacterium]